MYFVFSVIDLSGHGFGQILGLIFTALMKSADTFQDFFRRGGKGRRRDQIGKRIRKEHTQEHTQNTLKTHRQCRPNCLLLKCCSCDFSTTTTMDECYGRINSNNDPFFYNINMNTNAPPHENTVKSIEISI